MYIKMSESIQNNVETYIGDNSDYVQALGDQTLCNVPSNLSGMPSILPKLANNIGNPNYGQTLLSELMKPNTL